MLLVNEALLYYLTICRQYLAEKEIRELQCQLTEAELNERKYTALAEFLQTPTDKLASGGSIPYGVDAEQEVSQTNGHVCYVVLNNVCTL